MRSFVRPWRGVQLSQQHPVSGHRVLRWDVHDNSAGSLWMRDRIRDWWEDLKGRDVLLAARSTGTAQPFGSLIGDWDSLGQVTEVSVDGLEFQLHLNNTESVHVAASVVEADLRLNLLRIITSIGRVVWIASYGQVIQVEGTPAYFFGPVGLEHEVLFRRQLAVGSDSVVVRLSGPRVLPSIRVGSSSRFSLENLRSPSLQYTSNSLPLLVPNQGVLWRRYTSSSVGPVLAFECRLVEGTRSPLIHGATNPTSWQMGTTSEAKYQVLEVPPLRIPGLYLVRVMPQQQYSFFQGSRTVSDTLSTLGLVKSEQPSTQVRSLPGVLVRPPRLSRLLGPTHLVLSQQHARRTRRPLSLSFVL